MESTETLHFDFERVGSSRRRISSILKAPRTSVKETESGLKEPQGEKSKPTEKRRSSRRVSFAATKNVVVFSKDMTSSSDEQSPPLSLTSKGADSQDANKSIYDGMENLLKAPLQVPQKDKIRFFSDPVLSDYCDDKTVLFGEDTACMDMTHCHTILIDKDSDKSDLNFTINTEMSVSKICKPTDKEDAMLQKNIRLPDKGSTHFLNAEPASDFEAFLASVSQHKGVGNNTKNQKSTKARDQTLLFGGDDTECMDMTHCHTVIIGNDLNETDLNFTKTTDMPKSGIFRTLNREGNIPQGNMELPNKADTDADFGAFLASLSKGFGNNSKNEESCPAVQSSSVPLQTQKVNCTRFLASLNARRTVIDKENQAPAPSGCSVSKPQGLNLRGSTTPSVENDFMDLTKSHTVTIDGRGVPQSQQAAQAEKPRPTGLASTNASLKSPEPDDMDFTRSQTVAITFKSMDVPRSSLSSARRGKMSVLDPNKTQIFSADDTGMELTGVIDGTEEQENIPEKMTLQTESRFSLSRPRGASIQRAQPVNQQQRINFHNDVQTSDPTYTDDMEMTKSQTVVIDSKGCRWERPNKTRKSLSTNRSVMFAQNDEDMEFTEAVTGHIEGRELGSESISMDLKIPQTVPNDDNFLLANAPDSNDMEITKSQTVAIDTKDYNQEKPVRSRKSLSTTRSVMFTQNDEGMELTEALTGQIEANVYPNRRELDTQGVSMDLKTKQTVSNNGQSLWAVHLDTDDMEMTKCQTIVIDSKHYNQEKPVGSRKSLSTNRSVMFTPNDDGMELTEAFTGQIEASSCPDRRGPDSQGVFMDLKTSQTVLNDGKSLWTAAPDTDDMEMTKSQTVVIDSKNYNQEKPVRSRKSLSTTRSVMFTQNDEGMDLTEALTGQIEANVYPSKKELDTRVVFLDLKTNQTASNDGKSLWTAAPDTDDMEMTKSQTVVIDSKNYNQEKTVRSRKSLSANRSVFTQNDEGMELTEAFTGQIEANNCPDRRECDTRGVSMDLKMNETVLNDGKGLWAASPDSDDMEMTKSQTVVIDSKHPNQEKATTSRKSLSTNRSVLFAQNDDHIEMTEALTGHTNANSRSVREGANQTSERAAVSFNQTVHQNQPYVEAVCSEAEDMEITRSQGVVIDSKNRKITGTGLSYSSHTKIADNQTDLTESHEFIKGSALRKGDDTADDMEITRSQTVVIDTKHKTMSADGDPNLHTQATDCEKSISYPITDTTFSSRQMTSQANVLQMSTDCEDMGLATGKASAMDFAPTDKLFPFVSLPSKPCESERIPNDPSSVTGQKSFFPSLGVDDDLQLTSSKHIATDSQVTKSLPYMANESKSQCSLDESYETKMKSAKPRSDEHYSAQLEEEDVAPMSPKCQTEVIGESSHVAGRGVQDQSRPPCAAENVDSAQPDPVSPSDHTVTERSNPISQKAKSRRRSILDLQSKLRRISQIINDPAQSVIDDANVALPCFEATEKFTDNPDMADTTGCSNQKTVGVLSEQPDNVDNFRIANHETKPLTARLSFGGFLPKLPTRPKPVIADHLPETTNTFKSNVLDIGLDATPKLLSNFEMYDLNAEQLPEMSSEEDLSVTVDDPTRREDGHCSASPLPDDLEDDIFSLTLNATKSLKRPCPENGHDDVTLKQKRKQEVPPTEVMDSFIGSMQWDANATEEASNVMTKTIDGTSSSSTSTCLKSESTFDSTYKYSQCDSQISGNLDNEFDFYKKIEDGSITVNEFLRYFGINFIIHNPRPSALPDNCSPEPKPKMEHLLREMFIYQPKRRVYEAECEKLTRMIEELKPRMLEQDQPLKNINESLLQELANLSKEQLLSFGAKLKERKVYFRKKSRMLSHEMKADMYSELVHTTQEAKQKLEETILETDILLKDFDARIDDLEAELAAVDGALRVEQMQVQNEVQLTLKNKQEELDRLNGAVVEKEKQIVHMENEKKSKVEKLNRLQEEVEKLQKHTAFLHRTIEWKLILKEDGRTRFSFLHNTLLLEVVHQPSNGLPGPNDDTEQKLLDISFHFQLNEESEFHNIMVHDLLSEVFNSETDWLKKYSTTHDIPMLLHDVSLAVSRLRLLGEEIYRLKRWGALRLDILEINCADRQVQIVFSSLKAFVKFQLTLAVTCAYPFGGVKLQNFQNYIGNTRVDQIEDILSSTEPARGYLTKILKKIHDHFLV